MYKLFSDVIERAGVELFKNINKKESSWEKFKILGEPDLLNLASIYEHSNIFTKCDDYNDPNLVSSFQENNMEINTFSMLSKYTPSESFRPLFQSLKENQQIYFEEIKARGRKAKKVCLVYLHGFSERDYSKERKFLFSKLIKKMPQLEVLAIHLPYHMKRSPEGQPYSGAYIFDSHPQVTIEGFRQGVHDISQVISYASKMYEKVIVGGFSLGGLMTSFLATCDHRADLYIMGQAGAKLPETLKHLDVCPGLTRKREHWIKEGKDFEALYSPLELENYKPVVPSEKVVTIAGYHDRLITYPRVKKLRRFFQSKHDITYESGHIGAIFYAKRIMGPIINLIEEI